MVVTCPSTSPPVGPARVGGRVLLLGALRGPAVLDVADRQPQQFDRRLVGGEVAAVLGDLAQLVVQRLDRVGGVDDPAQGRGEGQEGGVPLPGPLPRRRRLRVLAARVGLAEGVQGPSGGLLVGGGVDRAQGGGDPLAVPCGRRTAWRRGSGGPRRWGPWSRARTAPGGLGQAGQPVAAHDQHAPSTPLLARSAHTWAQKEAPSPSWIQILKPRA